MMALLLHCCPGHRPRSHPGRPVSTRLRATLSTRAREPAWYALRRETLDHTAPEPT